MCQRCLLWLSASLLWVVSPASIWAGPLIISEFVASSVAGLRDETGAVNDWIEIQNVGPVSVDLAGWHLTDTASQLTKWTFPSTNLPPNGFLVVFASGANRVAPGAPLHTNFKLDSNAPGEFLGLVEPDGVTLDTAFSPTYPQQFPDISYGFGLDQTILQLVSTNSVARYLVPGAGGLPSGWADPGFDDSSWASGAGAFGYDTGVLDPLEDFEPGALLGSGPLAYYRFSDPPGSPGVNLGLLGTDADASFSGTAQAADAGPRPPGFPGFEAANGGFVPGSSGNLRIPAQPGFNVGAGPFTLELWFSTTNPTVRGDLFSCRGPGGEFGVQVSSQSPRKLTLLHNKSTLLSGGTIGTNIWYHMVVLRDATNGLFAYLNGARVIATLDAAPLESGVDLVVGSSHTGDPGSPVFSFNGIIDEVAFYDRALSTNEILLHYKTAQNPALTLTSYTPLITTDLGPLMHGVASSALFRFSFSATNVLGIDKLKLRVRYDDGFVAFLNGVEVASAAAPAALAWDSTSTSRRPDGLARALEEFDLNGSRDLLLEGTNVLAIQGLNWSADNADFLLAAELESTDLHGISQAPRYFVTPTPGAANGIGQADLGPILRDVAHSPAQPRADQDLLVTARVSPTAAPLAAVTLRYRVMYQGTNTVPMFDDGLHGDGMAGDGVYGASIPAVASKAGQMVRWQVWATDTGGRSSRWPLFDDPTGSPEYLGTVVFNPAVTSAIPVLEWFAASPAAGHTRSGVRGSLYYGGRFYDNVFFRDRGSGTVIGSQKVDFNKGDEFALDDGYDGIREANLNTNGSDPTYVRPALAFELFRRAGNPAPLVRHMQMRVNGLFDRVGLFIEQVDSRFLDRNAIPATGALYKFVQRSSLDPVFSDSVDGVEKKSRRTEPNTDLQALVDGVRLTLTPEQRARFLFDNVNLPELINYLAVRSLILDADDVRKNFYFYRDTEGNGEWSVFPWDKDWTFGIEGDGGTYLHHPFFGDQSHAKDNANQWNVLWTVIFNDPRPREMYLRRLRTLMDAELQPPGTSSASGLLEQRAAVLVQSITKLVPGVTLTDLAAAIQIRRDDLYRKYNMTGPGSPAEALVPFGQPSSSGVTFGAVEFNPPSGNQAEEFVEVVNANDYAVDVSGWTLSGGIRLTLRAGTVLGARSSLYLSPDVRAFRARASGPRGGQGLFVQGNYSGQISARGEALLLADEHGRPVASVVTPAQPTPAQRFLEISEIMYHPAAPPAGGAYTRDDFEYLELRYLGTDPLDLPGLRFTQGIGFEFTPASTITRLPGAAGTPPANTVLLVRNRAAFASRYGASDRVAGEYSGTLDDNGETLRLEDGSGEVVFQFAYRDDWYRVTDGAGLALRAASPRGAGVSPGDAAWWVPTAYEGHRPGGVPDPLLPPTPHVVVSELLANSGAGAVDRVELEAPPGTPADVSGWFLTDDLQFPKKYRIPDGVVIPPGGRLLLDEGQFNTGPTRFAFSSAGEGVWLIAATPDGLVLPWAHGFDFGPSEVGVAFARYVTGAGTEVFLPEESNTFGLPNSMARVGPLVISEVHYHPPDLPGGLDNTRDEFVELVNITSGPLPLQDSAIPPNPWIVSGGISYAFPPGVSLAAGARALLVSFDPSADPAAAGAFRSALGVGGGVPLFGPYSGKLGNPGDRVSIRKPGEIGTNGPLYIVVDRVDYGAAAPWGVAADGAGASLQRVSESGYGNDPANWVAATPSPGAPLPTAPPPVILRSPEGGTWPLASTITLSVETAGAPPTRFQWRLDGSILPGATNSSLLLTNLQAFQAGAYDVEVFNPSGSRVSAAARVGVDSPMRFLQPPRPTSVGPGSNVTLNAFVFGTPPLRYQWYRDGVAVPGAVEPSLLLRSVQYPDTGVFRVVAIDAEGRSVSSSEIPVTVAIRPSILSPPQSVVAVAGDTVSFSVGALGQPLPLVYRWRKNTAVILTLTNDASQSTLVLTNVQAFHAGRYSVIVTNSIGASSASQDAILTVLSDADGDGLPDTWEQPYGLDPNHPGDGDTDLDHDGMTARAEWLAGTDPTQVASRLRLDAGVTADWKALLRFTAVSNHSYGLVFRLDPASPAYYTLTNLTAGVVDRVVEVIDPYPPVGSRFYQVVTPMPPDTRAGGPVLLSLPMEREYRLGEEVVLSVAAAGQGTLGYRWYGPEGLIPGATASTLRIPALQPGQAGSYRVEVRDARGSTFAPIRVRWMP